MNASVFCSYASAALTAKEKVAFEAASKKICDYIRAEANKAAVELRRADLLAQLTAQKAIAAGNYPPAVTNKADKAVISITEQLAAL